MNSKDYNHSVALYSGRLLRFVRKLLQDDDSAADVSQNCFMRLWENLDKVEVDKAKSWLFTVAYRESLQLIAKQKKKTNVSALDSMMFESPMPDLKDVIDRCLSHLPEIQRSVLMLRDYEGYEYLEIGKILELKESQVKVYLFRARQKMKEQIKDLNLVM
jgi:RNA polymerase sigma factor (sigma-70 family)